ncbi:MAG: hypothetical protein SFU98_02500 [Leptospiraceae bacterium]|nr:hypothetical protein [Leptospiraceae bacterium]
MSQIRILFFYYFGFVFINCLAFPIYESDFYPAFHWQNLKNLTLGYHDDRNFVIGYHQKENFNVTEEKWNKIQLGSTEKELYSILGSNKSEEKFSFCEPFPYDLFNGMFIPVYKKIKFEGNASRAIFFL